MEFAYSKHGQKPDSVRKSCYDCAHCFGIVTLWCGSQDAINYRGTRIPGCEGCRFWKPMKPARWWHFFDPTTIVAELDHSNGR